MTAVLFAKLDKKMNCLHLLSVVTAYAWAKTSGKPSLQDGTLNTAARCCVIRSCRMHSVQESFVEQRVPGGMQYMSVVTHLSTVQIIFMNKFLVEFLDYLAGVLSSCCMCWLTSAHFAWVKHSSLAPPYPAEAADCSIGPPPQRLRF